MVVTYRDWRLIGDIAGVVCTATTAYVGYSYVPLCLVYISNPLWFKWRNKAVGQKVYPNLTTRSQRLQCQPALYCEEHFGCTLQQCFLTGWMVHSRVNEISARVNERRWVNEGWMSFLLLRFFILLFLFLSNTLAIMNNMEHFKRSNFSSLKQSAT